MATSKLSVKLKTDSGASGTDLITNSGASQISGGTGIDVLTGGTGSQAAVPLTLIGNHPDALASTAFVLAM